MESEESFKIAGSVAPDNDLQLHVNTAAEAAKYAGHIAQDSLAAWHPDGTPVLRPGRMDAYRFMPPRAGAPGVVLRFGTCGAYCLESP